MEELCALVNQYIHQFTYAGMFGVLILCGFGLPVPEEVTFLAAGYLVHLGVTDFRLTMLVCLAGVMIGDSITFLLGRRWGGELLGHRIMRKLIPQSRLARARARFGDHWVKTIFICRFLPGARAAAFFTAGSLGMRYRIFFLVDFAAALISVPVLVLVSYHFGDRVDDAARCLRSLNVYAAAAAVAAGAGLIVLGWSFRRSGGSHA